MLGLSAGSIMLGAHWAEWPDDGDDHGATLVPCTGVVADLVVDCHDEASDWEELRAVARLLAATNAPTPRFIGIPTGGAVVVDASGAIGQLGGPASGDVEEPARGATLFRL
jgi:hypothetical protein